MSQLSDASALHRNNIGIKVPKVLLYEREEASTHKSATTHAGNVSRDLDLELPRHLPPMDWGKHRSLLGTDFEL